MYLKRELIVVVRILGELLFNKYRLIARYDVNVSPDKRTIFIHHEKKTVDAMKVKIIISLSDSRAYVLQILLIGCKNEHRIN